MIPLFVRSCGRQVFHNSQVFIFCDRNFAWSVQAVGPTQLCSLGWGSAGTFSSVAMAARAARSCAHTVPGTRRGGRWRRLMAIVYAVKAAHDHQNVRRRFRMKLSY